MTEGPEVAGCVSDDLVPEPDEGPEPTNVEAVYITGRTPTQEETGLIVETTE